VSTAPTCDNSWLKLAEGFDAPTDSPDKPVAGNQEWARNSVARGAVADRFPRKRFGARDMLKSGIAVLIRITPMH
jgi:hypothetical protein